MSFYLAEKQVEPKIMLDNVGNDRKVEEYGSEDTLSEALRRKVEGVRFGRPY